MTAAREALSSAQLVYGSGIHDYDSASEMVRVADTVVHRLHKYIPTGSSQTLPGMRERSPIPVRVAHRKSRNRIGICDRHNYPPIWNRRLLVGHNRVTRRKQHAFYEVISESIKVGYVIAGEKASPLRAGMNRRLCSLSLYGTVLGALRAFFWVSDALDYLIEVKQPCIGECAHIPSSKICENTFR